MALIPVTGGIPVPDPLVLIQAFGKAESTRRKHGAAIGIPGLAPHDLRRTYAQIGYDAGVPITQIAVLLGHNSVATTQRYLDLDLIGHATESGTDLQARPPRPEGPVQALNLSSPSISSVSGRGLPV
jgi:integrase